MTDVVIREVATADEAALLELDRVAWSPQMTPAPEPNPGPFFNERTRQETVLVAELDGAVTGYAKMHHPTELPASEHVWEVTGLVVHPRFERRGAGRALMQALMGEARQRGGRRMTLRVLAPNERARRLYERLGFEVEGVLRGEFRVGDGDYVDDILMARPL